MKLKNLLVMFIAVTTMFALQSCDDNDSPNKNETARVQLKLVDAPGDYHAVMVNVVDVQYNLGEDVEGEGGWKSFTSFEGEEMIDLTELVGGVNHVLSDEIMPVGVLHQIRLVLGNGNTVSVEMEDGSVEEYPLDTPSAQQSGLKLNLDTELEAGYSYTFVLDWDVQQSIVNTGSGDYKLKPVIRVQAEANSGSIDGTVTGDLLTDALEEAVLLENVVVNLYQMGAMEGSEPYATTTTNSEGYFKFEGLPTVDYKVMIEVDGFNVYTMENVSVDRNEVTSMGTIELTLTE